MRRAAVVAWLGMLFLLVGVIQCHAQMIRFRSDRYDCRPWAPRFDSFISYSNRGGFNQPAAAWDVETAALSGATAIVLHEVLHAPSWLATSVSTLGFGIGFHVAGYARGEYPVSQHWVEVLNDRAGPSYWLAAHRMDDSGHVHWARHVVATGAWLASTAALCGYAR